MNKRDFLKGTAALSVAPAILPSLGTAAAATTPVTKATASIPTPSYVYDSARRAMRFYRHDEGNRAMFGYFATT